MSQKLLVLVAAFICWAATALAQPPLPLPLPPLIDMQGTPEERAACAPDVHRFCESEIPDTMRVLACLQVNRTRISLACRSVLERHGQ